VRRVVRLRDPDDAAALFENALAGAPPDTDLVEAYVERALDDGAQQAALAAVAHAYTDRDGNVYEGLTLYDVDARDVAREAGALIEPAAGAKGLAFTLEVPDAAVPLITDGGKARQILLNLCGNAVKFTESGSVRLRVRAGAARVGFEIEDTGIGIAAEHHARIFERFWQVDGRSTRATGGLGIGLAAAREYARLLGGDVEVDSEPGRGSTFTFWLPSGS
jgi:signal transduction histidine kinase